MWATRVRNSLIVLLVASLSSPSIAQVKPFARRAAGGGAAPAFVKSAYGTDAAYCNNDNSAGTAIATFGSDVLAGSVIVVAFQAGTNYCSAASGTTIADSRSNTYAEGASLYDGDNSQCIGVWYSTTSGGTQAGPNTVTVTFPGPIAWRHIAVHEYSGVATSSALDDSDSGETGASASWSTPSLTTTSANHLVFAAALVDSGTQGAGTAGSGFTQRVDCGETACNATTCGWFTEDKIQASAGTATVTGTWATAPNNSMAAAIALKKAP